jgi:methyltransferase (TIGR00027 family)
LAAAARALHRLEPPPLVLDDTLALALGGEDARELMARLQSEMPPEALLSFSRWICIRARVPEDAVARAIENGVDQYVILGAGLDSFAYRRPELCQHLRVFEVDHPASQAWKRRRVEELGIAIPPQLVFAPVDFEHQALRDGLVAAGFDPTKPAVFSWLGVTIYLTLAAIRATLATVCAGAPGTTIIMEYGQPPSALNDFGREVQQAVRAMVVGMGEPIITSFIPSEIDELVRGEGFGNVTHFGPEEALETYFPGRQDVRFGAQRMVIATVLGESAA